MVSAQEIVQYSSLDYSQPISAFDGGKAQFVVGEVFGDVDSFTLLEDTCTHV